MDLSIGGPQAAHPVSVSVEQLRMKALDLRGEGKSYRKVADALGISVAYAHELVIAGLDELMVQSTESAEQVKVLELQRLDDLLDRLLMKMALQRREMVTANGQKVQVPNPDENTVAAILKVMERRAKMLGLDAPTEISGAGGGPIQVANVGAGDELLARVDKLVERLNAGESPEAVAASIRASATVVEEEAKDVVIQDHPSSNGVAPS